MGPVKIPCLAYALSASAGANCTSTDTVLIRVRKRPIVLINPASTQICAGLSTSLKASGAVSYSWSPAAGLNRVTGDSVVATLLATTTYQVSGTAANGCAGHCFRYYNHSTFP
jgi:hypothetical protein